jgi:hypothetical protein
VNGRWLICHLGIGGDYEFELFLGPQYLNEVDMCVKGIVVLFMMVLLGFSMNSHADTQMLNRHLVKLLGTWKCPQNEVSFFANRTILYQGRRYIGAIAQGTIQLSKRKATVLLPYQFQNGKLQITDHDKVMLCTFAHQ